MTLVAPSLCAQAQADATALLGRLTKPAGSLGALEDLAVRLAGIERRCPPTPWPAAVAVFAADHGVVASGVTPWPPEVTAQMVSNIAAGGAAISVLARQHGLRLVVVDVGVASAVGATHNVWSHKVRHGSGDLSVGAALTTSEVDAALEVGAEVASRLVSEGSRCLLTGEMGIGNTTPAAAVIAALTGAAPEDCVGRGTGIDDVMLAHKRRIVAAAVARLSEGAQPVAVLAEVGGLEIAALAGYIGAGARAGVSVLLDGVITLAGACVAEALWPGTMQSCVASHRSVEPGASVALAHLGLSPLIDLGMRLGEGSGAATAYPLLVSAARLLGEMATFDGAGITENE
ncbi:MAG: nicotinate-nucleotide--dimethylbenzimidazole phosphoribosyltransferase [Actinobacteria bacterium]|uniref:Nicotinate-nucleotide--dimethylbenzimidazole phosphoribosyltransferase n=1 Tax=freshwater metagenome TaxID=449393 RepID=A0A6J7NXN8_9ZZZZ|nr:nicotinate-nucleotide--dimethylbenzimidazole phosphoribosyltransferase [Actinomycetota bacterium]MSX21482.1 nicotinate-nucleotide--dimethylbenzimidazole phosphoribosyltransferase [Actinomycetota bacterium]MSX80183.1 nicotinate-nucleotide--dimethylbenzimidazole phosphoribosyltransferase [Actinomycetota bacterium]